MVPERYANWMDIVDRLTPEERAPLLALMNVAVQVVMDVNQPLGERNLQVAGAARFRWYACAEPASGLEEALQKTLTLLDAGSPPDRVVIEGADQPSGGCTPESGGAKITILGEGPSILRLQVDAPADGWLLLADTYYPGWEASFIDPNGGRQKTTIYPADYVFRGIQVKAGETILEMRYRPVVFGVGAALSLFAWLFALISIIMNWRFGKDQSFFLIKHLKRTS